MNADFRQFLVSLLGSTWNERVTWDLFPQGVADPAMRLTLSDDQEGLHMQGRDGLSFATVRIGIRGKALDQVWAARDVLKSLHGHRGTFGGTYFSLIEIRERGGAPEHTGSDLYYFRVIDAEIWSRQAS